MATSALRLGWLAGSYSTQPQENASCQGLTACWLKRATLWLSVSIAVAASWRLVLANRMINSSPLPREDIGLAEGRFHQVGDGDQCAIALFMPPGIIDVLEAIEVDKRQAHRLMAALGRQQGILCQGEEPRRLNSPVSSSEVAASSTLNSSSTIAARSLKICISWAENDRGW